MKKQEVQIPGGSSIQLAVLPGVTARSKMQNGSQMDPKSYPNL